MDLWAGIYAIMLPSSGFSVAHSPISSPDSAHYTHTDLSRITTELWELQVPFTGGWCINFTYNLIALLFGVIIPFPSNSGSKGVMRNFDLTKLNIIGTLDFEFEFLSQ